MAYTPDSTPGLESQKIGIANKIIAGLENQPGLDVLPATAALPRILTGIWRMTGYKFKMIGHGRMRETFDICAQSGDSIGLVLKLGSKQATARDIALTLMFPEDRAKIYAATDYGVVADYVSTVIGFDDPRTKTEDFEKWSEQMNARYIGLTNGDIGFIGARPVIFGSSTRVIRHDAKIGTSSTQQTRTV